MLRVAVAGALGRMGRVACTALQEATDVTYAGGLARTRVPDEHDRRLDFDELLRDDKPDVLLDLTTHPDSVEISMNALAHGVRPVIGASGWSDAATRALDAVARERGLGAMLVPNFSIGAILMMRFARRGGAAISQASRSSNCTTTGKKDAPSGTAAAHRRTHRARRRARARADSQRAYARACSRTKKCSSAPTASC